MTANPWKVDSIQEFAFLNCPECTFKTKHEDFFQEHAHKSHPLSSVLFAQNIDSLEAIFLDEIEGKYEEISANQDEHAYALTLKAPVLESNCRKKCEN